LGVTYILNKKESVSSGFLNTKRIVENKILKKKSRICKGVLLIFAKMSFTTKKNGLMTTLKTSSD